NLTKYSRVKLLPRRYHCNRSIFAATKPQRRSSYCCSRTLNSVRSAKAVQSSMFL
ncbi:hypothetical protein HAX54_015112, partial [Datura stramonium]|nr:hypothetical protein [Datura stramonium]